MATGRTTEGRTVSALTKTSGSAVCTGAPAGSFSTEDVGRAITGTGVPASTTILSVQSATAVTLSANASASNSAAVTLGAANRSTAGYEGWSPETAAEAAIHTVAGRLAGPTDHEYTTDTTTSRYNQRVRT